MSASLTKVQLNVSYFPHLELLKRLVVSSESMQIWIVRNYPAGYTSRGITRAFGGTGQDVFCWQYGEEAGVVCCLVSIAQGQARKVAEAVCFQLHPTDREGDSERGSYWCKRKLLPRSTDIKCSTFLASCMSLFDASATIMEIDGTFSCFPNIS